MVSTICAHLLLGSNAKQDTLDSDYEDNRASTPFSPRQLSRLKVVPLLLSINVLLLKACDGVLQRNLKLFNLLLKSRAKS
jgi:hypothetical protein